MTMNAVDLEQWTVCLLYSGIILESSKLSNLYYQLLGSTIAFDYVK